MKDKYIKGMIGTNVVYVLVAIVVVLMIGVAVILLFPKKINSPVPPKATSNTIDKPIVFDTTVPDPTQGSVEAKSEILNYNLIIPSQIVVVKLLKSWGVYNRTYDLKENGKNTGGVNSIEFILTDKPQNLRENYFDNGKSKSSVGMVAKGNTIEVRIYFSESALSKATSFVTAQALYPLYLLSHPQKPGVTTAKIEEEYGKVYTELDRKAPTFIIVKKS